MPNIKYNDIICEIVNKVDDTHYTIMYNDPIQHKNVKIVVDKNDLKFPHYSEYMFA
jgi:hypothetical protein